MDFRTDADSIRYYCRHHELSRPNINWFLIVFVIIAFELLVYACLSWLPLSASSFLLLAEAAPAGSDRVAGVSAGAKNAV